MDHRSGWNPEAFRERYSEVLERYDYIVGDWGYNQLRLKGFYRDNHPKATKDSTYSTLSDYINEYCNFGCAYFVLHKTKEIKDPKELKELKEAQEAFEGLDESRALDPETSADKGDNKDKEPKTAGRQSERVQDKEFPDARGKRESREPRESKDSRAGKHPKSWKEGKVRENRDHRERSQPKPRHQAD